MDTGDGGQRRLQRTARELGYGAADSSEERNVAQRPEGQFLIARVGRYFGSPQLASCLS